jgi:hypothetical protein
LVLEGGPDLSLSFYKYPLALYCCKEISIVKSKTMADQNDPVNTENKSRLKEDRKEFAKNEIILSVMLGVMNTAAAAD